MLRPDLAPLDSYLADAVSRGAEEFLAMYPHIVLIVAAPEQQILRHPRGPQTVFEPAHPPDTDPDGRRGASLDSICLEVKGGSGLSNRVAIGRSPDADVVLLDASVSRFHAELRWSTDFSLVLLKDLGSRNGSFCNGQLLPHNGSAEIRPGDVVSFGSVTARMYTPRAFLDWLEAGAPKAGAAPAEWPRLVR